MMGDTPTTFAGVAASAARMPGTASTVPTLTTGLDGAISTMSASAIAASTPGPGVAFSAPIGVIAWAGRAAWYRIHHSWKCRATRPGSVRRGRLRVVDHDVRLDPVVGHRQQRHTRAPSGRTAPT